MAYRSRLAATALPLILAAHALAQSSDTAAAEEESLLFKEVPVAQTATLHARSLRQVPANVTVLTAEDIKRFGFRTLAEALASVRSLYVSSDGPYQAVGVRGFLVPGDYNTRTLVMLNGHVLTENVYSSTYQFGEEFPVDMDLVSRIEIVRGPTSALYGTNGILATINIFTKSPSDAPRGEVSVESGSFGRTKVRTTGAAYLGHGANLLLSASVFGSAGRSIHYDRTEAPGISVGNVAAAKAYHTFANLVWRDWSVVLASTDAKSIAPTGYYWSDLGDSGNSMFDQRNFLEATWARNVGRSSNLNLRFSFDQYRWRGVLHYPEDDDAPAQRLDDSAQGQWISSRLTYSTSLPFIGDVSAGTDFSADVQNRQLSRYGSDRPYRDVVALNRAGAVFVEKQWVLGRAWTLHGGGRLDVSRFQDPFVSPRLALVYERSATDTYKVMYGRSFRNPSTYERTYTPNPLLRMERMNTLEFAREHKLGKHSEVVASAYFYTLEGFIEGIPVGDGALQYRNHEGARAFGAEVEWIRSTRQLQTSASFGLVRTRHSGERLPNSPAVLGHIRAAAPLFGERWTAGLIGTYRGTRLGVDAVEYSPVFLTDITLTRKATSNGWEFQAGLKNLAGTMYRDPISDEHRFTYLPREGRTLFFKLTWTAGK